MNLGPRFDASLDIPTGATAVTHPVVKVQGRDACSREDQLTVEEPLEIRLAGHSLSITMRTPGHDEELVAGLLFAERLVASADDIDLIAHHPGPADQPDLANVINVLLTSSAPALRERRPRSFVTSSACGLCGRTTVEDILENVPPITSDLTVPVELFYGLEPAVSAAEHVREDRRAPRGGPLRQRGPAPYPPKTSAVTTRSTRSSATCSRGAELPPTTTSGERPREIRDRAEGAGGIPIVASVSAPSSLAVQLASRAA